MKKLHLFRDFHETTEELATETIGLLGRKGSGKTYGAGVLIEELVRIGVPTVVISPLKVYYGLRLSADGKSPGLDLIIIGGLYGDVPLNESAGALIADLVIDSGRHFVIDTSQFSFSKRKRFCTEFGERFWLRKKEEKNPTPVHVVLEEAQTILPQNTPSEGKGEYSAARMLGVWEEIVRLGRNAGIGVTLISQRPQSVNKEALTQIEILVCFQLNGTPERKAVRDWVTYHGLDVDLVEQLPQLGIGKESEAYLWSPSVLKTLRKVHFREKHTFDSSATPKAGQRLHQVDIKPIDLGEVKAKIAALEQEAKASDPGALRRRVVQLEQELAAAKRQHAPAPAKTEVKRVEVPILKDSQVKALERQATTLERAATEMKSAAGELGLAAKLTLSAIAESKKLTSPAPAIMTRVEFVPARARPAPRAAPVDGEVKLKKGMRDMISALLMRSQDWTTRAQLGVLTGLSTTSGTWADYLSTLRRAGYIEERGDQLRATAAGADAVGGSNPAPSTHAELMQMWKPKFKAGARRMLEVLVAAWPNAVSREAIGQQAEISTSSGTFADYLSTLRRAGIVEDAGPGELRASDTLFPEGRSAA